MDDGRRLEGRREEEEEIGASRNGQKSVPAEMVRKRYVNDESAGVAQRIGQVRRLRQKQ